MTQGTERRTGLPANWIDCEEQLREFERGLSTLRIIADACGNGGYTETRGVEEALIFVAEHLGAATHQLFVLLSLKDAASVDQRQGGV